MVEQSADYVVHYKDCSRYNWHDPDAQCDGARCHLDPARDAETVRQTEELVWALGWVFDYLTSECDWDELDDCPEARWVRRTAAVLQQFDGTGDAQTGA